jgi:phage-related protein
VNIAVLSVRFTGDVSGMDRAFSQAQRKVTNFKRQVKGLTNIPITADVSQFNRQLDSAASKAKQIHNTIVDQFRKIRVASEAPVTLEVKANTTGIRDAISEIAAFRQAAQVEDVNVTVSARTVGFPQAHDQIDQLDNRATTVNAKWSGSVTVNADTTGFTEATSEVNRLDRAAQAADGQTVNVNFNVDSAKATADLAGYQAVASAVDAASDVHTTVDVDMGVAVAQLGAYTAVSATANGLTNIMSTNFAMMAAMVAALAGAFALAMTSLGPLLGGLGALVGLWAGAYAGAGLLAGAIWTLQSGLYDGGNAMALLTEQATAFQQQAANAFGPASLYIAEIASQAMVVASQYFPMLGTAATAAGQGAQAGLQPLFNFLRSQVGMDYMAQIFGSAPTILATLIAAVSHFGAGFVAVISTLMPYGVMLAEAIYGVATAFSSWATSAQGAAQINAIVQSAIPVFSALWNVVTTVGGALLNFALIAGGDVATTISVIGGIISGLISGFTWLYETVGGAGIAFGALALAITPIVAIGFLATGAITAFLAAAWPVAAVAAAIAVAATLIYNNWSTIGPIFSALGTGIMTALEPVLTFITGTLVPAFVAAWPQIQAGAVAFVTWLQTTWTTLWATIGPTVIAALTAVYTFIVTIGTQISTWWLTYFGPAGMLPVTWSTFWNGLVIVLQTVWAIIQARIQTGLMVLQTLWTMFWPGLSMIVQGAWTIITSVIQGGIQIIQGIITVFAGLLTGNWQVAWDGVKMILEGAWTAIQGIVEGGVQIIQGVLTNAWALISAAATTAWTGISTAISAAWEGIKALVTAAAEAVSTYLDERWAAISTSVTTAWTTISTAIETAWNTIYTTIETWLTSAYDYLETQWSAIYDSVISWWDSIWTEIDTSWNSIYTTIETWITSAYDYLETQWTAIYDSVISWWDSIWTEIDTAWNEIYTTVETWANDLWTAIEDTWTGVLDGVAAFATSLYDAIYEGFWDAVAVGGDALASLLEGIQAGIDALPVDIGIDVSGAASAIRDLTGAAEGMITGFSRGGMAITRAFAGGGCACDDADTDVFRNGGVKRDNGRGGIGTPTAQPRMHLWNEQTTGNEAFIAQRGPRAANIGYLGAAANWFGLSLAPGPMDDPAGSMHAAMSTKNPSGRRGRSFANGGLAAFQLGGTHYDWDSATEQIKNKLGDATGWCGTPNTYYGHSYVAGATENQSIDWWGGGRGSQLDIACGDSLWSEGSSIPALTYQIWQGEHSSIGAFPEDPHTDHIHQTFAGAGAGGFLCKNVIRPAFQKAADLAKEAAKALLSGVSDSPFVYNIGEWAIDDGMQALIDWILQQIPGCSGGGGTGDCSEAIPAAVKQLGAPSEYLQSMESLGQQESGMDMGAVNNYDSNAAAGTPSSGCWQMIPSTFAAHADPSCTDPNDALCQAMSSINYQEAVHGGPVWNSGYARGGITSMAGRPSVPVFTRGGIVPGSGPKMAMVHGGERVLTDQENRTLEALATNPATRAGGGGGGYGGAGMVHNETTNVNVEVVVNGGLAGESPATQAERIAASTGDKVVDVLNRTSTNSRYNRRAAARRFS